MKNRKGITLIALVITIIVLLILSGVSIAMLTNENSILKRAIDARELTEKATEDEQRQLTIAEATMNFKNKEYTDKNGDKVTIPEGFAVSQVEGENTVNDGLVIIDSDGNEFVWIPCGKLNTETGKYNTSEYEKAKNYVSEKWSAQSNNYTNGDDNWTNPDYQIEAAKDSIENYGGFYVARYEAGVPTNATFHISNTSNYKYVGLDGENPPAIKFEEGTFARGSSYENELVQNLKPVSKKGEQAWNLISGANAETVSKNMYKNHETLSSFLIDSIAWNYICFDIFDKHCGVDVENSKEYGNYNDNVTTNYSNLNCLWAKHIKKENNSLLELAQNYKKENINDIINERKDGYIELATGASDDFKIYNIYDMAGNLWEWTTETFTRNGGTFAVARGGSFTGRGAYRRRTCNSITTEKYQKRTGITLEDFVLCCI